MVSEYCILKTILLKRFVYRFLAWFFCNIYKFFQLCLHIGSIFLIHVNLT